MKNFFLLIAMLVSPFAATTSQAQDVANNVINAIGNALSDLTEIQNGGTYALYNIGRTAYIYERDDYSLYQSATCEVGSPASFVFTFEVTSTSDTEIKAQIRSAQGRNFPNAEGINYRLSTQTDPTTYTITLLEEGVFHFEMPSGYELNGSGYSTGDGCAVTSWYSGDGNNGRFSIIPVSLESEAYATYVISDDNGVVYTSEAIPASLGQTITSIPDSLKRDFCSFTVTPTTIWGNNVVPVTVSYSLPFQLSKDYDNAKWYYATVNGNWVSMDSTEPYYTSSTKNRLNNGRWAFAGNPYEGIYVMNKAAGSNMRLTKDGIYAVMRSESTETWKVNQTDGGFNLCRMGTTDEFISSRWTSSGLGIGSNNYYSNWVLEEVPAITVDVTYALNVDGTIVNSIVEKQVAGNSELNIPTNLTDGYNTLVWDFSTNDTIGNTDCIITVTGALKPGVITNQDQLSNTKAYTLTSELGSLGTNGTQMVSTAGTNYVAGLFAIINYEDSCYLYSVADKKFVTGSTQPALTNATNTLSAIVLNSSYTTTKSPLFFIQMGGYSVNTTSNFSSGIVLNTSSRNSGNQYCIIETQDFDPTEAINLLKENTFNRLLAQLEAISYGSNTKEYSLIIGGINYTSEAADMINTLKTEGYSDSNLNKAKEIIANTIANLMSSGFMRIRTSANNIAEQPWLFSDYSKTYSYSNRLAFGSDLEDANGVWYYDGQHLYNLGKGYPMTATNNVNSEQAQIGTGQDDTPTEVRFETAANGEEWSFNINFTERSERYLYARPNLYADAGNTSNPTSAGYTFTLDAVTELPLTLDESGMKAVSLPVAFNAPSGLSIYFVVSDSNGLPTFVKTKVRSVAANTPVILAGEAGNYTLSVEESGETFPGNQLLSTHFGGVSIANGQTAYALRTNSEGKAVFAKCTAERGFSAYFIYTGQDEATDTVLVEGNSKVFIDLTTSPTTYCPFADIDLTGIEDLQAYTATSFTDGTLTLSRIYNIPAGTGVVLYGTPNTYVVPYATKNTYLANLLTGVTEQTVLDQIENNMTNYTLAEGDQGIAFYRVDADGETLNAGKAYLQLPTASVASIRAFQLFIEEDDLKGNVVDQENSPITGIDNVSTNALSDKPVYDLQGRRVMTPAKGGIYIIDGRKVIVK